MDQKILEKAVRILNNGKWSLVNGHAVYRHPGFERTHKDDTFGFMELLEVELDEGGLSIECIPIHNRAMGSFVFSADPVEVVIEEDKIVIKEICWRPHGNPKNESFCHVQEQRNAMVFKRVKKKTNVWRRQPIVQ